MKRDAKKLLLCGSGRVGQGVMRLLNSSAFSDFIVSCAINKSNASSLSAEYARCDGVIDFSHPSLTCALLEVMQEQGTKPCVIGTTGFAPDAFDEMMCKLTGLALQAPMFYSSNFSIGINVMKDIIPQIRTALSECDVKIIDVHHKLKKDSPSGTALMLARLIEGIDIDNDICSIRCGDVVGKHEVIFASGDEVITIKHEAFNREVFSKNALRVMRWLVGRVGGVYSMSDFVTSL
ncbi:4-hydroxy-tetrahydrodipicolinate reductase [Rickettsiales endosymbiont of Paramecium tredecaurelia]|uniref:4-hydroxy-tetrahydrodipicolinate reductase n=1 Tax=Candidatus Sarmatiella mevalonica TaxID=2770581 RepID=UPI001922BE36|nr:dihydrodipicolinate reductase C-terminal domain-containing protein [Candidatus Sarmatiella mevalonica]MBL3284741.1 4-hydroxy-tetrahydrodipicolinate reductase [Candidatus Sarmatiella mevalonica]